MRKLILICVIILTGCQNKTDKNKPNTQTNISYVSKEKPKEIELNKKFSDFVPKGFFIYEEEGWENIKGDLNKDGLEDIVLLIKATDKSKIVQDENRGPLDRNRRGIIILFNKGTYYEIASENHTCFTSENEEGGAYYAPELGLYIKNGNLCVHYYHGRYGYWKYTFRYQNNDFEMIGFDHSSNNGPTIISETSINFLTKKKLYRENLNFESAKDDEVENFKDTWTKININNLMQLSEIKDFDELELD